MWLYFRDDDLGWNPKDFSRLVTLFARHDQRFNAAAIPAGLTDQIIKDSIPYSYQASPYLQVVTHGFSHQNHQKEGKKSEFGIGRDLEVVRQELRTGREQLTERFENYFPCFVPPWNRMEEVYMDLLPGCGYRMISRDEGAKGLAPLPEFNITVDLHTSREATKPSAKEIFRQLAKYNEEGRESLGVMLHHTKMTEDDYTILDELLKDLSKRSIQSVFFSDMLPGFERRADSEVSHV